MVSESPRVIERRERLKEINDEMAKKAELGGFVVDITATNLGDDGVPLFEMYVTRGKKNFAVSMPVEQWQQKIVMDELPNLATMAKENIGSFKRIMKATIELLRVSRAPDDDNYEQFRQYFGEALRREMR